MFSANARPFSLTTNARQLRIPIGPCMSKTSGSASTRSTRPIHATRRTIIHLAPFLKADYKSTPCAPAGGRGGRVLSSLKASYKRTCVPAIE